MRVPYCRERLLYCGHRPFFCRDGLHVNVVWLVTCHKPQTTPQRQLQVVQVEPKPLAVQGSNCRPLSRTHDTPDLRFHEQSATIPVMMRLDFPFLCVSPDKQSPNYHRFRLPLQVTDHVRLVLGCDRLLYIVISP